MAIYKEDIVDIELNSGSIHRSFLNRTIGEGDALANRFGIRAFRNGVSVSLGGSCTGYFIRPDGETVVIPGTIGNNEAYVVLPQACYVYEGQFALAIKVTDTNNATCTYRIVDGVVANTTTSTIVDPGTIVPSIEYLIASINAAVTSIPQDYSTLDAVVKSHTNILSLSDAVAIPFKIYDTGSVNFSDGTISSSTTYNYTDYVDVSAYAYITYKQIGITSSSITAGIAWYDSTMTYISGIKGLPNQSAAGYIDSVALVPYGAKYARFTTFINTGTFGNFSVIGYSETIAEANAGLQALWEITVPPTFIAQGSITGSSGNNDASEDAYHNNRVRTARRIHKSVRRVVADSGYSIAVYAYLKTDGSYVGRIVYSGIVTNVVDSYNDLAWLPKVDLWVLYTILPNCYFRMCFRKNDNADQTPNDIAPHIKYFIDRDESSGAVFPTQRIPADTAGVYAIYDAFVTAGFATRTTLATVQSLPIYQYDFKALDGWMVGGSYEIDTSGERLFPKYQILLTSGMHGDERTAVLGLYEFMNLVCNDPNYVRYLALCDFKVIPVCNPTGYNANTRNNYQDININRTNEAQDTVECQAIEAVVDSQAYDLYVDIHNMRTDTASETIPGGTGAMAFSNATPSDIKIKEFRAYMEATTHTTQVVLNELSETSNNKLQPFYPWDGQDLPTFRQYGYTHIHNGMTVGSPITATFEVSRRCYSLTGNNVDNNGYAVMICDQCTVDTLTTFIDKVTSGYFS